MLLPNGPSIWPIRLIVNAVRCGNNAWHQEPKGIAPGASVLCAVSCLLRRLCLVSESRSCSDRSGGWMWQGERFVAAGSPTGAGNMLRSFHWFRHSESFCLHRVRRVPSVLITAGVGRIGSTAMPRSDPRTCVSVSLAFPLVWLPSNEGGPGHQRSSFNTVQ
jgi:hypothetical protein